MKRISHRKYTIPSTVALGVAALLITAPAHSDEAAPAAAVSAPASAEASPAATQKPQPVKHTAAPAPTKQDAGKAAETEREIKAASAAKQRKQEAADSQAVEDAARKAGLKANSHTVLAGQTVGTIASFYGKDASAMLAANGLSNSSVIHPGQVLKLSGPAVKVETPATTEAPKSKPGAKAGPAAAAEQAAPTVRTISIAGAGGQEMIDRCIGPIHFTPIQSAVFITEHDYCGGWGRFSGIVTGETVTVSGYGTYTVQGIGTVPQGGTTSDVVGQFGYLPSVILQTCIPGTSQMRVIALG